MTLAERFAHAAQLLAGVRFRLHGRDPATGLDCVGLVACALESSGRQAAVPNGYGLRNLAIERHLDFAALNCFAAADGPIVRGDLLLARCGPAQHHLIVALSASRFVHAHAGLRRVVIHGGPLQWPLVARWRLEP